MIFHSFKSFHHLLSLFIFIIVIIVSFFPTRLIFWSLRVNSLETSFACHIKRPNITWGYSLNFCQNKVELIQLIWSYKQRPDADWAWPKYHTTQRSASMRNESCTGFLDKDHAEARLFSWASSLRLTFDKLTEDPTGPLWVEDRKEIGSVFWIHG